MIDDDVQLNERRFRMNELVKATTEADVEVRGDYMDRLRELAAREVNVAGDFLELRHAIGTLTIEILDAEAGGDAESTYGKGLVKRIAYHLRHSERSIYSCRTFAIAFTREQINEFREKAWPWRSIAALLTVHDAAAMKEFKERFDSDELKKSDDMRRAISAHNREARESQMTVSKKKKPGGRRALAQILSFGTTIKQTTSRILPDCIDGIHAFVKDGRRFAPATAEKIAAAIQDAKKHVAAFERVLPQVKEEIEAALAQEVEAEDA